MNWKIDEKTQITASDISGQWLAFKKRSVKESTYLKFRNIVKNHIIPVLGNSAIDSVSPDDAEKLCRDLIGKTENNITVTGLAPKTVADILSVFRSIMNFAGTKGYAGAWSEDCIKIKQSGKELSVISRADQHCLIEYLKKNLTNRNLGIIVCLFTGLRIGEICALKWEDISLPDGVIYVNKTLQRLQIENSAGQKTHIAISNPKSSKSTRAIPIPCEIVTLLKSATLNHTGYFLSSTGEKWVEPRLMESYFKKVLKCCNLPYTNFHTLRHTFATRCIEAGCDVKTLSEILGHSSIAVTMNRYVHPSMDFKRQNLQLLTKEFLNN